MSLTIEEFEVKYPGAFHWGSSKVGTTTQDSYTEEEGFLEFTESDASIFAGPFEGNHAMYSLQDNTETLVWSGKGKISEKLITSNDKFLAKNPGMHVNFVTSEKPYSLYLCGNDDSSYTKFYSSMKEAQEELELLKANEPLKFKDIIDLGFVFTN